jgi:hypothetical protein
MKTISKLLLLLFIVSGFCNRGYAQQQQGKYKSDYNARKAFSPLFGTGENNAFHSATGKPGPLYWQNQVNYDIHAAIDTTDKKISGKVTVTYINNSPYNLHSLWLQLDQNAFKKSSRAYAVYPPNDRNGVHNPTKGYELKKVTIDMGKGAKKADYLVSDTRMQIRLPKALEKKGHSMKFTIKYSFKIPTHGKDRMGRVQTKNGVVYSIAQWYPRMCVYDDVEGWNTLPYLGSGEFYLDYGNFDYHVTVPSDMLVVGSGKLQNPKDVLTKEERERLKKARKSDSTVTIHSLQDVQQGKHHSSDKSTLTWHYKMKQSRDVSWAASKAFIWDAARINLPQGKTALAESVYPVESAGDSAWGRSTEYVKHSIQIYSKMLYPYPYPAAISVAGNALGMEYPGIVFCSYTEKGQGLWGDETHELGHTWFPMIVGSNERKYGWMDEGLNTFINDLATKKFNNGEYYRERHPRQRASIAFNDNIDPIMTMPDVTHNQRSLGVEDYFKPAMALHQLRSQVLGKKRFDYAFRRYIRRWAFKHPTPWDFFNTMENASGEDLEWFWKAWFMHNWSLDQAVGDVQYVNGDPAKGALITLVNKDKMAMPVTLKIQQMNDKTDIKHLPVEIWEAGPVYTFSYPSTAKIRSVIIDPDHQLPDVNPANNKYVQLSPAPKNVSAKKVINHYIDAIGGRKALEGVKDIKLVMTTQIQGTKIELTEMKKRPDMYSQKVDIPSLGRVVSEVKVNGNNVSITSRGQKHQISGERKKRFQKQAVMFPVLKYNDKGYNTKLLGVKYANGKKLYVVQVKTPAGVQIKDYYDIDTGLRMKHETKNGSQTSEITYSNYQKVKGIKIPFKRTTNQLGRGATMKVQEVKINSGLKDSNFK